MRNASCSIDPCQPELALNSIGNNSTMGEHRPPYFCKALALNSLVNIILEAENSRVFLGIAIVMSGKTHLNQGCTDYGIVVDLSLAYVEV